MKAKFLEDSDYTVILKNDDNGLGLCHLSIDCFEGLFGAAITKILKEKYAVEIETRLKP